MKKFLMTCAAVMGVSLAFAATSFAATYTAEGNTVSIDQSKLDGLTADDQITVIVVAAEKAGDEYILPSEITDDKVLYINQEKNDTSFSKFQGMKLKGDSLADGTYIIAVGGSKLDEIITETFTVGEDSGEEDILWGDVNGDTKVNSRDLMTLKRHLAGTWGDDYTASAINYAAANVYKDTNVNSRDLMTLKRHLAGTWGDAYATLPVVPAS